MGGFRQERERVDLFVVERGLTAKRKNETVQPVGEWIHTNFLHVPATQNITPAYDADKSVWHTNDIALF